VNGNALLAAGDLSAAAQSGSSGLVTFLPLLLLVVAFYFFVIRPTRNRQRDAQNLQSSLQVGQEVMTTSGLYGRITGLEDDVVVIEAAPGTRLRWAKAAIARVVTPVASSPVDAPDGEEPGH
jgi:preprotein translocase subunit YajC